MPGSPDERDGAVGGRPAGVALLEERGSEPVTGPEARAALAIRLRLREERVARQVGDRTDVLVSLDVLPGHPHGQIAR